MENSAKASALRSVELFKHLPIEGLNMIAQETTVKEIKAGTTIFHEGDTGDGLYVVVAGTIDLIRAKQVISELKDHGFFGELALINDASRLASAVAKTDCTLLFLNKKAFKHVLETMPGMLRASMQVMMGYLRTYSKNT